MADNHMDVPTKHTPEKSLNVSEDMPNTIGEDNEDVTLACPSNMNCNEMQYPCIYCELNSSCNYGEEMNTTCRVKAEVKCNGKVEFQRSLICRYCYQTEPWEHSCIMKANCNSVATPRQFYRTNCSVRNDIICLGRRKFLKKIILHGGTCSTCLTIILFFDCIE
ncbi:almondex [Carabus blaptoides fortunei]